MTIPGSLYILLLRTLRAIALWENYKYCCYEHLYSCLSVHIHTHFFCIYPYELNCWGIGLTYAHSEETLPIFICQGCHNTVPPAGWPQQRRCVFSRFWRLQVQDQGASWFGCLWELSYWLTNRCLLVIFLYGGERWCLSSLPIKASCHHESLSSWPHLNLITFQRPHLQIPLHWGLGLQHKNFGRTHSSHSTMSPKKVLKHYPFKTPVTTPLVTVNSLIQQ